jgi:endonuclease/exonuclease/phosphatase family metal-dependent hydrolase
MKIISWNVAHRSEPWRWLLESGADVALLQEAAEPPADVAVRVQVDAAPWRTAGGGKQPWRTAVVRLSDAVQVDWIEPAILGEAHGGDLAVSRSGTLTAATVTPDEGDPITVVSMYAVWERPHRTTGGDWIYADASVHRLVSDLSVFVGSNSRHRIIAAGDLNIFHGYGDGGSAYWAGRYETVFARMTALGLRFVGPQAPSGRQADPCPSGLPPASLNVPTYHTNQMTPATAAHQLDFVFASSSLCDRVSVHARNRVEEWGPSDHCRVEIDVT